MARVKHSLPLGLSTLVVVMLAMLVAVPSRADTVTFNDLTDTLTITQVGSSLSSSPFSPTPLLPCTSTGPSGEPGCTGPIFNLSGATLVSTTLPDTLWIGDSVTGMISDVLQNNIGSGGTSSFFYGFFSDNQTGVVGAAGNLGGPCSGTPIGGCQIMEDGTAQIAGTVTWSDGSVDTFKFASDVSDKDSGASVVPEPSSIMLLLTGVAGLSILILRGRAA